MNIVSQFVNNFFTTSLRLRGSFSFARPAAELPATRLLRFPSSAPRCRQRERGVILVSRPAARKGFVKKKY